MSSRRPPAPPSGAPPPPPPPAPPSWRPGGWLRTPGPRPPWASGTAADRSARFARIPWDWTDVLLTVLAALVLIVIASNITIVILNAVDPSSVAGVKNGTFTPVASLALQTAVYAGAVGAICIFVFGRRHATWADLGWRRPDRWVWVASTPLVLVGVLVVSNLLLALMSHAFPGAPNSQCVDIRGEFGHSLGFAIPAVSLIAPLAEETIFRGFLYGWLRRRLSLLPALLINSALFAAAHGVPILFLPLMAVGAVLVLLYERSGSLLPGVVVHGLFNLVGIIAILGASGCT